METMTTITPEQVAEFLRAQQSALAPLPVTILVAAHRDTGAVDWTIIGAPGSRCSPTLDLAVKQYRELAAATTSEREAWAATLQRDGERLIAQAKELIG